MKAKKQQQWYKEFKKHNFDANKFVISQTGKLHAKHVNTNKQKTKNTTKKNIKQASNALVYPKLGQMKKVE